ncbi:MAG: ABC transporter ATP-binding protein [Gemmatimonadota bacterium]
MTLPPLLEARGLVRDFGPHRAVADVDLTLDVGELMALFGPNGAGKSTLLRLLSGSLRPTEGELHFRGVPFMPGDPRVARQVGVLSHRSFLYRHLTARENLRFYGRLYGVVGLEERVARRLETVGLQARMDHRVATFSRGMVQRLALARTLLHDPALVVLDEPFTGLDLDAALRLSRVLTEVRSDQRAVILVTHDLQRGRELATRVGVMSRGRLEVQAPAHSLDGPGLEALYRRVVEVPS